jgi:cell division septation protein DedD
MKGRAAVVSVVATCALLVTPLSALARLGAGAVSALHPATLPTQPATDATDAPDGADNTDNTDGADATTTSPSDSAVRATYTGTVDLADPAHTDLTATRRGLLGRVPVGGLSGMDCDPAAITGTMTSAHCLALSDDRGQHGPVRVYPLDLTLDPATTNPMTTTPTTTEPNPDPTESTTTKPNPDPIPASTTLTHVTVGAPLVLTDSDGTPYRPGTVDPESIRLTPDGMVWSSEGDESLGAPAAVTAADSTGRARFTGPSSSGVRSECEAVGVGHRNM